MPAKGRDAARRRRAQKGAKMRGATGRDRAQCGVGDSKAGDDFTTLAR